MSKYLYRWYLSVFICVLKANGQLDLEEGEKCMLEREGIQGTCVSVRHCLSILVDIQTKQNPQICSYKGLEPIVCCTDCELVNDTSQYLVGAYRSYHKKNGNKASDKCLEYLTITNPQPWLSFCDISQGSKYRRRSNEKNGTCYIYTEQYFLEPEADNVHRSTNVHSRRNKRAPQLSSSISRSNQDFGAGLHDTPELQFHYLGQNANVAEYPHMALLGYGSDVSVAQWLCGGSVISDSFILTAAHCIASATLGPVRYIVLGILKRSDPPETWQLYTVKKIIPHPQYKSPIKYHDIALLETNEKIKFGNLVLPICLYDGSLPRNPVVKNTAESTGWGSLGPKQALADTLQVTHFTKLSDEECAAAYPPNRNFVNGYDPNTQVCYGDKVNSSDSCKGDSGGPLFELRMDRACTRRLIGVTSFGRECGVQSGSAGIYTKVLYYVPWIESIVWP